MEKALTIGFPVVSNYATSTHPRMKSDDEPLHAPDIYSHVSRRFDHDIKIPQDHLLSIVLTLLDFIALLDKVFSKDF